MSGLNDKQSGEKLWAFEVNSILKGLRSLAQNIAALAAGAHFGYISTVADTADEIAAPPNARIAIITLIGSHSVSVIGNVKGEVFLDRTNKTTAILEGIAAPDNSGNAHVRCRMSVSWSGDTITITPETNSGTLSVTATGYFYT